MNSNNDPWFHEVKCIELKKKPVIIEIQLTDIKKTDFWSLYMFLTLENKL